MMVGIHAHAAFQSQQTGVEYYTRKLLQTLLRLPSASEHDWHLYTPCDPAPDDDPYLTTSARVVPWRLPFGWTQIRLPLALRRDYPDVFFSPAHILPPGSPPGVAVVHGVEFDVIPDAYSVGRRRYLRWVTQRSIDRAHTVIAASESTRSDLLRYYNAPEECIVVVHHGPGDDAPNDEMVLPDDVPPFLVTIGRLEHKKNILSLIEAFEIAAHRGLDHQMVFIGGNGYGAQEIHRRINASPLADRIVCTGYISAKAKWALLRRADAFLFPSQYEGFGFPVLEAQQVKTPVIAANTSSLPELLGDSAILTETTPLALAESIEMLLSDTALRERCIERGSRNVRRFSWNAAAQKTLDVLTDVLQ